jgi:hypothetical protein
VLPSQSQAMFELFNSLNPRSSGVESSAFVLPRDSSIRPTTMVGCIAGDLFENIFQSDMELLVRIDYTIVSQLTEKCSGFKVHFMHR